MGPDTGQAAHVRPFAEVLSEVSKGIVADEAATGLAELVAKVKETGEAVGGGIMTADDLRHTLGEAQREAGSLAMDTDPVVAACGRQMLAVLGAPVPPSLPALDRAIADIVAVEGAAAALERRYPGARPDVLDDLLGELGAIARAWRRQAAEAESPASPGGAAAATGAAGGIDGPDREVLGRLVREVWVARARQHPDPKPSWLVPWDELGEWDKETDRRIGTAIATQAAAVAAIDMHALHVKAVDEAVSAVTAERERTGAAEATPGVALILAERLRQISAEGYTPEHDAEHDRGQLALAAAAYALAASGRAPQGSVWWPFDDWDFKPGTAPLDDLVKAGALIAAEIDRIIALKAQEGSNEEGDGQ